MRHRENFRAVVNAGRQVTSVDEYVTAVADPLKQLLSCEAVHIASAAGRHGVADLPHPRARRQFGITSERGEWGSLTLGFENAQASANLDEGLVELVTDVLALVLPDLADRDADRAVGDAAGPSAHELTSLVESSLHQLDDMELASAPERLAVVARGVCAVLPNAGFWISDVHQPRGLRDERGAGSTYHVVLAEGLPDEAESVRPPGLVEIADEPVPAARVRDLVPGAGDTLGDQGFRTALSCGGYDIDAQYWAVDVVTEGSRHAVLAVQPVLLALTLAALGFPRPSAAGLMELPWSHPDSEVS